MAIRAVIFDFGGVLCFHPTDRQIAEAAQACGLPVAQFLNAFWAHRVRYDAGLVEPEQYWNQIAQATGRTFGPKLIAEMLRREVDFWSNFDERVIEWIDRLRGTGMPIGILSNLPSPLGRHLRATGTLLKHFDHVTFSYELNIVKPQPEIYEHAIRGLKIDARDTLFIDDRPENIEGARAAGLQTALYTSWDEFAPARYGLPEPAVARRQ